MPRTVRLQAHPVLIPKFPPGARVLYDAYDAPAPVRGTVHKSEWKGEVAARCWALQSAAAPGGAGRALATCAWRPLLICFEKRGIPHIQSEKLI